MVTRTTDPPAHPHRDDSRLRSALLCLIVVVVTTVPAALLSGIWLGRWGDNSQLGRHAARLDQLPKQLGPWQMVAEGPPLGDSVERELGLHGYVSRIYENRDTHDRVSLLLMVGRAGPLVRHPPEICYEQRDNVRQASSQFVIPEGGPDRQFRLLRFRSSSSLRSDFLVAYGFGFEGSWSAPEFPRMLLAGKPYLYKLQALMTASELDGDQPPAGLVDLLQHLLPAVK